MGAEPDNATNAVVLLKAEHRKVEILFEEFQKTSGSAEKAELASQLCTELTVHFTLEEEIFYPACHCEVEDNKMDEAYVEHDGAKVLIAEIEAAEPNDDFYDAKVKVLSELIKHHIKEEEASPDGIFAQAKSASIDLYELGERLAARKAELKAQIEAEGLPTLETRSYSGHELIQGEPVAA